MLVKIAVRSLLQRRLAALLIIAAISLSLMALLISRGAGEELRRNFSSSVSGTDLIVAARAQPTQIMLYSVFRLGTPPQAMSAERWQQISQLPQVKWSFPVVLGDSVKGFSVIGTNDDYFRYFRYGDKHPLQSSTPEALQFGQPTAAVLGAEAARVLGYKIGDSLSLSHGMHEHSFAEHKELPFIVSAILKPTGTPVDRSVHVPLATLEALHNSEWLHTVTRGQLNKEHQLEEHEHEEHEHEEHLHNESHDDDHALTLAFSDLPEPSNISALFVGLKSRALTFQAQAAINAAHQEPLSAVIPGAALTEFWQLLGNAERLLQFLSGLMLITGLLGSVAMLQVSVAFRQREISLLRLTGASPLYIFLLLESEVLLLTLSAWVVALLGSGALQTLAAPWIASHYGLQLSSQWWPADSLWLIGGSLLLSLLAGLVPALSAYRKAFRL